MIIKPHDLKIEIFYVNPKYVDKHKTLSTHIFQIEYVINYINYIKRELKLEIKVTFDSKTDKINVSKAEFSRFFELELHPDESEKKYFNPFHWYLEETISDVRAYLSNNIPPKIIEISPPLMVAYETEITAHEIYEKLIKRSF